MQLHAVARHRTSAFLPWLRHARQPWFGRRNVRGVTSLPQIPGVILSNDEIQEDRLVSQVRRWAASNDRLSSRGFDLLQVAEQTDGRVQPRALCGLLRTQVHLAHGTEPVPAMAVLFYRSLDFLNREFWEDQVRRLCDLVAEEFLQGGRGLQLTIHHNAPKWAPSLEMGDHRLLAEVQNLHILGHPWRRRSHHVPELVDMNYADSTSQMGLSNFHRLCRVDSGTTSSGNSHSNRLQRGHYVLRGACGTAICGVEVLDVLPLKLLCASAWAQEDHQSDFGVLVEALLRQARRSVCSVLADSRDPRWQRLFLGRGSATPRLGLWSKVQRLGVAITGIPVGLTPEEQAVLAQAPFAIPFEFVPFHVGRFVLV
jgi:hypothetical protein